MDPGNRKTDRKAVGLLVQLKHADVGTFAQEFAVNLSPGGMFIRSRQPQPVGTLVRFEVQIAGGVRVMRGQAVVRWTREVGDLARRADRAGKRLPTLALDTEIRFRSAAERAEFAEELTATVTGLVSRYHDAAAPGGRAHRLVVAAHPLPRPAGPPAPSPTHEEDA